MAPVDLSNIPAVNEKSFGNEDGRQKQSKLRVFEYSDEQHAEDLDGLKIGEHWYKYRLLEGRVMPPYVTPNRYSLSRRIDTKPSDICFVSFPKSGSTWLSYILVLMTENQGTTLRDSLHWVESSWTYPRSEEDLRGASDPRIFKSHALQYGAGWGPSKNPCRYIYIARNPKDVITSYFHFEKEKSWSGYYGGDWNHWFEQFVKGRVQRGDWFDHVLSWWEHRDSDNILFLKYEDLKKDTASILNLIAEFLDINLNPTKTNEILEKVQFQAMKSDDVLGDVKEFDKFFRKGKVGSWREQLTVSQNEFFDNLCQERLGSTGLSFDEL
ncbi:hypothetical protein Asppvi_001794 [Aspergillus pseudoviridinutans]|uniref:Sulfotransferase domain-containing protein n=1 Tax=Aspergillus pseudoviridinutans TaxID=1517512 RepID=A0A9P3EY01_9EURO|nr:uncharacterized protein Asppvi_001794 [Aspergillus pseudoviridinutans]GIJ92516.1 hypothetical protein Asppvi_001794 [Aspergillus pseudoviridinutans]